MNPLVLDLKDSANLKVKPTQAKKTKPWINMNSYKNHDCMRINLSQVQSNLL